MRARPCKLAISVAVAVLCALAVGACGGGSSRSKADKGGDERSAGDPVRHAPIPADAGRVDLHVLPGTVRIVPRIDLDGAPDNAQVEIARGEREGVQLAIEPAGGSARHAVTGIGIEGALAKTPGITVRSYVERPVTVDRGSPAGRNGVFHDALVPSAAEFRRGAHALRAGDRLFVWVDVDVAPGVRPGTVAGAILVRDRAGVAARARLTVVVRQPTLPDVPTMETSIGVDADQLTRFEGTPEGSPELRTMLGRYFTELAAARISTADPNAVLPGTLPGLEPEPGDEQFLTETFERRGAGTFRIPLYTTYPFPQPLGADRAATVQYLRRAAADLRRRGWLQRSYVYLLDEPDTAEAGAVRELAELVHEADPELRLLLTSEPRREFDSGVDIWVPNISSRFDPAAAKREQRRGRDVWWYASISTFQPWPTLFIDDTRPSPRALGWLAWQEGVTGFLYWTATHWHDVDDPYTDPATFRENDAVGNGDGMLLYPGRPVGVTGPVPSVRLFQLRDGLEDHDLLTMASCAGTAADRRRLAAVVHAAAPSLTSVPNEPERAEQLRSVAFGVLDRAAARGDYEPASRGFSDCRR